ncbi:hypothetical protein QTG56_25750 (plasmid) [Rossellomorea sp. AcN35-11]|nr:hypothetical protein QTG56_25750 [Rossellomorea sp. AcN35-11]
MRRVWFLPRLEIIKNGIRVDNETLIERIKEIQKDDFSVKEERDKNAQAFMLTQVIAGYSTCARYFPYILEIEQFLRPENRAQLIMRNEAINEVAVLSLVSEKIDHGLLEKTWFPLSLMKEISELVRIKQVESENFNPSALGWDVCCKKDLSEKEMKLFGQMYLNTQRGTLGFLEKIAQDPDLRGQYVLYRSSIEDKEGFISKLEHTYQKKANHQPLQQFKELINTII